MSAQPATQPTAQPTTHGALCALRPWLEQAGASRPIVLTGPTRRFLDQIEPLLDGLDVAIFDQVAVHVPEATVDAARAALDAHGADAIITLGGGSATGLGKALRLELDLPFVAIATTYAGSEMTRIYGVRRANEKQTGRDDRVRPDAVIHDPALTASMPRTLTITSLMNALAHPLSALSTGSLDDAGEGRALKAIAALARAIEVLVQRPTQMAARRKALEGAALAARILDVAPLGGHHRLAHHFGGRLGAGHADLHAALLPHTAAVLLADRPDIAATIAERCFIRDLPGDLFTALKRAGGATALRSLADPAKVLAALDEVADLDLSPALQQAARAAVLGRDPSSRYQPLDLGLPEVAAQWQPADTPQRAVVALHGRGANAESILAEVRAITGDAADVWAIAPQAPGASWYPKGFATPIEEQAEAVDAALAAVTAAVDYAAAAVGRENVVLLGFSQGACLAAEWVRRADAPIGGLVALSGAALGPEPGAAQADLSGMPALLTIAAEDNWVPSAAVEATAARLEAAGASVDVQIAPPGAHTVRPLERIAARWLILGGEPAAPHGFGNAHAVETLPGALPLDQNSPRKAPYGLYPEQINGSGFVAHRAQNLRAWFYRVRPSAQHTPFEPIEHPTWASSFDGPAEPNLTGWPAPPIPEAATDFVDGLITLGGAGGAALRRGWAAHLFVANRSMNDRALYNADGDLLIIPQQGRLTLLTDQGVLDVAPGQVAVMPRGIRFSVLLPDGAARGYVGEVYGRHFELPERGPVGANGLTDARHFVAPTPWHEDRLHPGYRLTARFGGALFEARQDHSPYDVAAWHGEYTPYRYDLKHFSPVVAGRFDHPDPSIFTVLSAPLDELGSHSLDFVFFPPRWDVSEHTFRPPYFHRNATTEFNGIIQDPGLRPDGPFEPGGAFLTPAMTAHGVVDRAVDRGIERGGDDPHRIGDGSMWFQFESALPLQLTPWARANRRSDWPDVWGVYRTRYTPDSMG